MSSESHGPHAGPEVRDTDLEILHVQLGRTPRGVVAIPARCADGHPTVARTLPRLPDGTPFPTTFYLTCPAAVAATSSLESQGVMKQMTERLATDDELATAYANAHEQYLASRAELGHVPEIEGISAGGMPTRVKCLHVLVAHSLAAGPGVNPLGDETVELLAPVWQRQTCRWPLGD